MGLTVKNDTRGGLGVEVTDNTDEIRGEPKIMHELKQAGMADGVEGIGEVNVEDKNIAGEATGIV